MSQSVAPSQERELKYLRRGSDLTDKSHSFTGMLKPYLEVQSDHFSEALHNKISYQVSLP